MSYGTRLDGQLQAAFTRLSAGGEFLSAEALASFWREVRGKRWSAEACIRNAVSADRGGLSEEEFVGHYRAQLNGDGCRSLADIFLKCCRGQERTLGRMSADSLSNFLRDVQGDGELGEARIRQCVSRYRRKASTKRRSQQPHLAFEDFVDFLSSPTNDLADPSQVDTVHQDMSKPLSHYFVNSSHNTYLTGE